MNTPLVPRQVRLELSAFCNAHCRPCHAHGDIPMGRVKGVMAWELFEKCIHDIHAFPELPKELVLSNWGETFLYQRWYDACMMAALKLPSVGIILPTNGVILAANVERLAQVRTLRLVNVSVNAITPETWEAFHGIPSSHLPGIEEGVAKLKRLRPDVTLWVSMVRDASYQSPREVEDFTAFWSRYGQVQISQAQYCNRPDRAPKPPLKTACRSLFDSLAVLWDGRAVTGCCWDSEGVLWVGDATRQPLLDCWHSKEYNRVRRLHSDVRRTELDTCKNCTFA